MWEYTHINCEPNLLIQFTVDLKISTHTPKWCIFRKSRLALSIIIMFSMYPYYQLCHHIKGISITNPLIPLLDVLSKTWSSYRHISNPYPYILYVAFVLTLPKRQTQKWQCSLPTSDSWRRLVCHSTLYVEWNKTGLVTIAISGGYITKCPGLQVLEYTMVEATTHTCVYLLRLVIARHGLGRFVNI
jgi:hypothetical protein